MTEVKTRSQWWDVWDQFKTHKGAVIGLGFLIFITLFVLIGPWLWTLDAGKLDVRNKDLRPFYTGLLGTDVKWAWAHPLGTDNLGRDVMANLMAGGQISLAVGWTAMLLALLVGTLIGGGGRVFQAGRRAADAVHRSGAGLAAVAAATGDDDAVSRTVARCIWP